MAVNSSSPSKAIPFDAARTRLLKDNDGTPLLRYSISPIELPALPKRPGRRIRHYHEAVENQWRAYWENKGASVARAMRMRCEAKGETFSALSMSLSTTVSFQNDDLLCVCQEMTEDAGDSRPNRVLHTITWDTHVGAPLPLSSFFPNNRRWKRMVLDALQAEARKLASSGLYLLDEGAEANFVRYFSSEHYLLTERGLAIFYPQCTVASHIEGILIVPLPFPIFDPCNQEESKV